MFFSIIIPTFVIVKPIKTTVMEKITVKFYRIHKYTDPSGRIRITVELGLIGSGTIAGILTAKSDDLPDVVVFLGPFGPTEIMELEKKLRREESEGKIKNLVMEEEITGVGVKIDMKVTPQQIQMN